MSKTLTDPVTIPRALLQDLIDDVADYAASREFRKHEAAWRDDNLARAREVLATQQPEPRDEVTDDDKADAARWRHIYSGHYIICKVHADGTLTNLGGGYVAKYAIDAARAGDAS